VTISFFEIYNENVFDLLGEDSSRDVQKKVSLTVREDKINGFTVVDLSRFVVRDKAEFLRLVEMGNKNRAVQGTVQNSVSSRSHSFLTVDIERELVLAGALDITPTRMWSRLNLVDLAGSERFKHYTADDLGTSLSKETLSINQSLSCLSNVINALTSNDKVIPYRDSKLTRLLKHSLGGNSKTLFIACVNPSGDNMKESLATLRYATRAKQIKNKPTRNTDPADALSFKLQEMGVELAELRPLKSSYGELRKVVDELVKATDEFPFLRDEKKTTNDDLFEETKSVPKDVVLRDADTLRRLGEVWSSSGTRHKQNLIEAKGEIERIKRRMEEAAALEETDALRLSEVAEVRKELEALQQEKVKEAQLSTERLRKLQLAKETLEVDKESLLRRLADGDESSRTEIKSDRQERAALKLERQVEKEELQALRAQLQKHQQSVSEKDQELRTLEQRCMQELKTAQVPDLTHEHTQTHTQTHTRTHTYGCSCRVLRWISLRHTVRWQSTSRPSWNTRKYRWCARRPLALHASLAPLQRPRCEDNGSLAWCFAQVEMQMFKDKAVAEGDQRRETDLAKERDLRLTEREAAVKDQFARERVILEEREVRLYLAMLSVH
jgi:kinesin family protein 3/17